jgi:hypothetical protein
LYQRHPGGAVGSSSAWNSVYGDLGALRGRRNGDDLLLHERPRDPITLAIIVALFAVQRFGTASVARMFGPIMLV